MSQSRMRKVVSSGDGGPHARVSVAKASGDSAACTVRPKHETQRSRSKNKIPKSVRYDLENALVSLCDVWFEEIKPHLVRNNIKLHVHGNSAGGDHERPQAPAPPAPSAPRVPSAPLAHDCSHLDPGAASDHPLRRDASCAGFSSMLPTVSRVPCPRPPMPSLQRLLSQLSSSPQTLHDCTQTQSHNCEEKQLKRPRTRRKNRTSQPQPQTSWRVSRLCRTYSILPPAAIGSRTRRIASQPPRPPQDDNYQFIEPRRNNVKKNKSTQTQEAWPRSHVSVGCQWVAPVSPLCSSLLVRRAALPMPRKRRLNRPRTSIAEEHSLFQEDLIDIIGERNDKRLSLLYNSPERDDYPSLMNLAPLPDRQQKPGGLKKSPPWR